MKVKGTTLNNKKAGIAVLIPDNIDLKKNVSRDKEGYSKIIKGSVYQKISKHRHIKILSQDAWRKKLTEFKGEISNM